jgi:hypothetical protein
LKMVNSKFGTVRWACGEGLVGREELARRREGAKEGWCGEAFGEGRAARTPCALRAVILPAGQSLRRSGSEGACWFMAALVREGELCSHFMHELLVGLRCRRWGSLPLSLTRRRFRGKLVIR